MIYTHFMSESERLSQDCGEQKRLVSLDAYRGFMMLWIIGGSGLAKALAGLQSTETGVLAAMIVQLKHVEWEGLRFYDLIFPSFIFIVGVSLVYSLSRLKSETHRGKATIKVIRRGLLLWLIGIIYYGGISQGLYDEALQQGVRLLGVLQRIGICYLVAGILFLFVPLRGLISVFCGLLVGYWVLLTFVSVPGQPEISYQEGKNLSDWFDSQYLPFFKWNGTHDPEGILSTFPAIATCLLGVFAGLFLKEATCSQKKKCLSLAIAGLVLAILGFLWGESFPVIKNLWTSSFVLMAGGWSLILLSFFFGLIDGLGQRKWATPLIWVGMNSIAIYLVTSILDFNELALRVFGGPVAQWFDSLVPGLGELITMVFSLAMLLWLCRVLYQRKVFLKV